VHKPNDGGGAAWGGDTDDDDADDDADANTNTNTTATSSTASADGDAGSGEDGCVFGGSADQGGGGDADEADEVPNHVGCFRFSTDFFALEDCLEVHAIAPRETMLCV
jgi:hypothetical protein